MEVASHRQISEKYSAFDRAAGPLLELLRRPWFYYVTLLALQMKRVWGMWECRDLTAGDTCAYFLGAWDWYARWKCNFAWSPLYTAFYGMFLYVTPDAAAATALHRLAIVMAATLLVLAVVRRMLPAEVAWGVGAWWAVLPINFDTMYEVHLFALLPLLLAVLLVMSHRGPWSRGAAVGVLVADMLLLRNEVVIAAACTLCVCLWWEWRQRRGGGAGGRDVLPGGASGNGDRPAPSTGRPRRVGDLIVVAALVALALLALGVRQNGFWLLLVVVALATVLALFDRRLRGARAGPPPLRSLVVAYAVPVIVALAVSGFFYQRSIFKRDDLRAQLHAKHSVNMGQVFAFGYQQRHPRRWQDRSPWSDFPELCRRTFGVDAPTMVQMIRGNPKEVLKHFLWNVRLTPAGVQLMLFNGISGEVNPDYGPVKIRQRHVLALSVIALALPVAAAVVLRRRGRGLWRQLIVSRRLEWLALLAVAAPALAVIPTQRPRPSYLFALSLLLMTVLGASLLVIVRTFLPHPRLRAVLPVAMVLLAVFVPRHWDGDELPGPASLTAAYERLKPFQPLIDRPGRVFLGGDLGVYLHNYLGFAHGLRTLGNEVLGELRPGQSFAEFLDAHQVTLAYVDNRAWQVLEGNHPGLLRDFMASSEATGWRMIGAGEEHAQFPGDTIPPDRYKWALFLKVPRAGAPPA